MPDPARQGVVAVIQRGETFLVVRRSQHVIAPGAYCFPGGGIEPGETEPEALIRELREELAAEVRPVELLWRSVTPWNVALAWWNADLLSDVVPAPAEIESFHWLSASQMRAIPELLSSNHAFLDWFLSGRAD